MGIFALANDFRRPDDEHAGYAPLKILLCPRCTLAQLSVVVRPEILYGSYPYTTSRSQTMADHFKQLCADMKEENGVGSVIEIGSNDGHFLEFLENNGFVNGVVGVDPAPNLCDSAFGRMVNVICGTWSEAMAANAKAFLRDSANARTIIARHCFCHVDDWKGFIAALDIVSDEHTLVCIEVPYVLDTLSRVEFDQIYSEHLSYLTIKALDWLLGDTNWHIHKVKRYPIHGGSIVVMLRHDDSTIPPDKSFDEFVALETEATTGLQAWHDFKNKSNDLIHHLRSMVISLRAEGNRVAGFGASAKGTVWINACGLDNMLEFVTDTTEQKIGRMVPGTSIPVVAEEELMKRMPDYVILFAWNYREEILDKMRPYLEAGGKFIIPVPRVEIVGL
jgi:novobiocin biosynthesis protein NovU/D-mycarose 3-C-methyltransferase